MRAYQGAYASGCDTQSFPIGSRLHTLRAERLCFPGNLAGDPMNEQPAYLFVCVHNAGRSQMAAAWVRALTAGLTEAVSAGTEPAQQVNPVVREAMAEVGIELSVLPRRLTNELARGAGRVISMGCNVEQACPGLIADEDWQLEDPAEKPLVEVRRIRDEIRSRVEMLLNG